MAVRKTVTKSNYKKREGEVIDTSMPSVTEPGRVPDTKTIVQRLQAGLIVNGVDKYIYQNPDGTVDWDQVPAIGRYSDKLIELTKRKQKVEQLIVDAEAKMEEAKAEALKHKIQLGVEEALANTENPPPAE